VFAVRVLDDFVGIHLLDVAIAGPFVSDQQADFVGDRVHHELRQYVSADRINHTSDDIAATADCADDWRLARAETATAAPTAPAMLVVGLPADEGFVHLNDATKLLEVLFDQRGANAVAHIPSGFVTPETHVAMDLTGAHSLLAGQHQVDDAKPISQRLI